MVPLGQFVELSLPTADLAASLDFYLRLGFTEVRVNDVRPQGYAAVTDGQVVVGLHDPGFGEPALAFVRPDLARHARRLADEGAELDFQRLRDDEFNEIGLRVPGCPLLVLMEAPTFSPADDSSSQPMIGRCTGVSIASPTPAAMRGFFEAAGFLATDDDVSGVTLLTTPGLCVVLGDARRSGISLNFQMTEPAGLLERLVERLSTAGFDPRCEGDETTLIAPEGTRLVLGQLRRA